ncbi:MAB_1171c family putative transporter [Saccharopolyspora cebuensis]|uniref:MAB_1171c family putative transporter n=1 Tax=Saccharopolyspora cebuensis TaxID=418759 RepID=A0ABV4CPH4_9PSEU
MLVPNLIMWLAALIAAIWKASQLVRAPQDRGLRVVTLCTLLVVGALSAQLAVSIPDIAEQLPLQIPKLVQNVFLTFFFALLIILLTDVSASSDNARRGWRELGLSTVTSTALIALFLATPADHRGENYEDAGATPELLAFYLVGNLYLAYACARGTLLAWRAADHTRSRARASLRVAAAGLAFNAVLVHAPRVVSTSGRLAVGHDPIPGTSTWTTPLLAIGISVFFAGIAYPGARTGLIKSRIWITEWRQYRQLRPLWLALVTAFPNIALFKPTTPLREALRARRIGIRYYRRIIEIRDGLLQLSPYLEAPITTATPADEAAELVRDALKRQARATPVSTTSIVAAPEHDGIDADTRELLRISRAFAESATRPTGRVSSRS